MKLADNFFLNHGRRQAKPKNTKLTKKKNIRSIIFFSFPDFFVLFVRFVVEMISVNLLHCRSNGIFAGMATEAFFPVQGRLGHQTAGDRHISDFDQIGMNSGRQRLLDFFQPFYGFP